MSTGRTLYGAACNCNDIRGRVTHWTCNIDNHDQDTIHLSDRWFPLRPWTRIAMVWQARILYKSLWLHLESNTNTILTVNRNNQQVKYAHTPDSVSYSWKSNH